MHCVAGTSFAFDDQADGFGSCTGPDPSRVPDCYHLLPPGANIIKSKIIQACNWNTFLFIDVTSLQSLGLIFLLKDLWAWYSYSIQDLYKERRFPLLLLQWTE